MSDRYGDEPTQLWDRLRGEGDKAWLCFQLYRDMPYRKAAEGGPQARSQRVVGDLVYPRQRPGARGRKEISGWSVRWNWVARCEAYDAHLDKLSQDEFTKALRADVRSNINLARAMRGKAASALLQLHPGAMTAAETTRMADVAVTMLRREAGLATEIQGTERDEAFAAWLTAGDDPEPDEPAPAPVEG